MSETKDTTRRQFLTSGSGLALAGITLPHVHAAENNTLQIALIGCGGRGTGAAENALSVKNGPTKLVAMADVFQRRLNTSYSSLDGRAKGSGRRGNEDPLTRTLDVPPERRFIGFQAYKHAMDYLK